MPIPVLRSFRIPIAFLAALSLMVAACGGGEAVDQTGTESTAANETVTSTTEAASQTTAQTGSATETTGDTTNSSIEVDPSALPSDPSGYDAWSGDLCSLYAVDQIDSFFIGKGELATSEPLDQGCRWSVDGLPRSHYVDIVTVAEGTDAAFQLTDQVNVDGTTVDIGHGPSDLVAMVPTPDGTYLRVLIHGDFDAPSGPLGSYLDEAGIALAENLIARF